MPVPSLDDLDRMIIAELQGDLPLAERPFSAVAGAVGSSEAEVLARLESFRQQGILRRVAAILYHREAGYAANVMAVWDVPDDRADETGAIMASFAEVSHCYRRPRRPGWPYNLFTMIHGRDHEQCRKVAADIAARTAPRRYELLPSTREFKKTSLEYFPGQG